MLIISFNLHLLKNTQAIVILSVICPIGGLQIQWLKLFLERIVKKKKKYSRNVRQEDRDQ